MFKVNPADYPGLYRFINKQIKIVYWHQMYMSFIVIQPLNS